MFNVRINYVSNFVKKLCENIVKKNLKLKGKNK